MLSMAESRSEMKQIINLALRTEYSFQQTYGYLSNIVEEEKSNSIGIADIGNTFSHFYLYEKCKELGKKPIYGVRLMVVKAPEEKIKPRGQWGPEYVFIAKNHKGLVEIHELVSRSIQCMYYRRHIGLIDVWGLSENVFVIAEHFEVDERIDYIALNHRTSPVAFASSIPKVAMNNNILHKAEDKEVYQLFSGSRKKENWTYPMHILSTAEWYSEFKDEEAINNTHIIASKCNVEFKIGDPVRYNGENKIRTVCRKGAKRLKIDLKNKEYKERFDREMKLIKEKNFVDYFLIVSDMIEKAKKEMLVGPARGSSGGSLVCFLMGITTLDPIKWNLLFDRFIDVNRHDMPDIDIDFPDRKRQSVVDELIRSNGAERVKNIATVSGMKPRGAIGSFAKELKIEGEEIESIKNSIISVSSGDARYGEAMRSTFSDTEIGKKFIEKYPSMEIVEKIENHARHTGKHAAGVIVSSSPIVEFASINPIDNTMQMEGKSAEKINLLKIDCLGLATLSVLEDISTLAGFDFRDFYELDYKDDKAFKLLRDGNVKGIFQFEGNALAGLCRTIKVRHIEDMIAITALARPGPLHGGGAAKFSKVHQGLEEIEFIMDDPDIRKITEDTMGVIIYQEQVMQIMRQVAGFPWERVSFMRKVISKKGGKEAIDEFRERFISGSIEKGINKDDAESAWKNILEFAQYGFNRSHAVAYGMVSYWTAWSKAHYPIEFLIANLNSGQDVANKKRLIREMKNNYEFEIVPVDKKSSGEEWKQVGDRIVGPLTNIDGIGLKNATVIIRKRDSGEPLAKGIQEKMNNLKTSFDILYPCEHYWGKMFANPGRYGLYDSPTRIEEIKHVGQYLVIAQLMKKNIRDLNELQNVMSRGGELYEDRTKLLNITVEDDTGVIMGRIGRDDYDEIGLVVAEEGEEEKDWYIIKGKIIGEDILFLFISEIHKLGDGYSEGQTIRDI